MEKRGSAEPADGKGLNGVTPLKEKLWDEGDARAVWEEWQASGVPLATYARRKGLVSQRLRWWFKKLGLPTTREEAVEPVQFTPLRVVEKRKRTHRKEARPEEAKHGGHQQMGMEVRLPSGVRIQVGQEFDAGALRRLLDVVEARPC